jgi:hypothetical protein
VKPPVPNLLSDEAPAAPDKDRGSESLFSRFAPIVWINLAMAAAVLYGIVNDQVTVSLAPEYFSLFKRRQFAPLLQGLGWADAPLRLQAVAIGAAATWWFGLLLGMAVSLVGTVGRRPRLTSRQFLKAVASVILIAAGASLLFGAVAFLAEPALRDLSQEEQTIYEGMFGAIRNWRGFFAVGWWHTGAYLGGLVGTILVCAWVRRWRRVGGGSASP